MKKLLCSGLLLIACSCVMAQASTELSMVLKPSQVSEYTENGQKYYSLEEPTAKALQSSVTTLTETVKVQKLVIDSLKALTLNQSIQISSLQQQVNPADIQVNSPTLTIGSEYNGRTIKISSQCVVIFPSGLNIKCRIIRTGKGEVTIDGSILTALNYRRISGQPGRIDVDYTGGIALITGNLTK